MSVAGCRIIEGSAGSFFRPAHLGGDVNFLKSSKALLKICRYLECIDGSGFYDG
jgi:hypothetical protein